MSRKPAHIEVAKAAGRPYGRRAVWLAIRELGTFTQAELRLSIPHVNKHVVKEYVAALIKAGYVAPGQMITAPTKWHSAGRVRQYALIRNTGVDAPRLKKDGTEMPPTAQQHMWTAMKIIGWFTPAELAGGASTAEVQVSLEAAKDYVKHLHASGYLQKSAGKGVTSYRLINDTGGMAPMVQRTKVVFDPNRNEIMWSQDIEP